jgi:hypothetical protein
MTDEFIAGAMNIIYSEWEILGYEKEGEAAAYFLGIKR